jgi:hypothetical protein
LLKNETNFSLSSKTNYKYFIINIIKLNWISWQTIQMYQLS